MTKLIHCISGPRNISTALMYSFAQRKETAVVDEPLYAAYLTRYPKIEHPGREKIITSQITNPYVVMESLANHPAPFLFIKNMAHHLRELDLDQFPKAKTLFLVRQPARLIASFQKVISHPTIQDIGLAEESALYKRQSVIEDPVVVLTEKLAENPQQELPKLCAALNIDYQPEMLHWPKGPKTYDGVWADCWYASVHKSTHFKPFAREEPSLNAHGKKLLEKAMPYYDFLVQHAL